MIPLYTFDHALFLALNFDGGPVMDRLMTLVSGTAMWLPLYALILWLVWRREGWRRTLLFAAAIVLAIVLADMAAGIFKHSGPLKGPISHPAGGRCSPPRSKGWRSRPTH